MKKRLIVMCALLLLVIMGLIVSGYYLYYEINLCNEKECFYNSLAECRRTAFVNDGPETTLQYSIIGAYGGKCNVDVKILQIKRGTSELAVLEGKEMRCSLPLGLAVEPEKDLQSCHGVLKEEIQNIIIQRMHAQIVENLGKVSEASGEVI